MDSKHHTHTVKPYLEKGTQIGLTMIILRSYTRKLNRKEGRRTIRIFHALTRTRDDLAAINCQGYQIAADVAPLRSP